MRGSENRRQAYAASDPDVVKGVPVEERDEKGKKRLTGGKDNDRGTPQGGVVSPLLANLYMNPDVEGLETDQTWRAVSGANRVVRG